MDMMDEREMEETERDEREMEERWEQGAGCREHQPKGGQGGRRHRSSATGRTAKGAGCRVQGAGSSATTTGRTAKEDGLCMLLPPIDHRYQQAITADYSR